jgi:anthranilate phosphoribosyltransferase
MTSATAARSAPETNSGPSDFSRDVLRSFLQDRSPTSNERWRRWCTGLIRGGHLSASDLLDWWTEVVEFDPVLRRHVTRPVTVQDGTVVVAGSGKEQFKTFNVSTAAAILAAAAGTPVVKGVSRSVSAISGAADILDVLRIRPVIEPAGIPDALQRHNIAFVSYPLFCPRYADRYDGVFDAINPASFFMPVATLCVSASRFLFGLAHPDVELSARALRAIRPDVAAGTVVSTDLTDGETVDEYCGVGTVRLARANAELVDATTRARSAPTAGWRTAVAHRPTHVANAALAAEALAPGDDSPATSLVELNAALIVGPGAPTDDSLERVRHARRSGGAVRLIRALSESR